MVAKTSFGFGGKSDKSVLASAYFDGDGVAISSSSDESVSDELTQRN